MKFLFIALQLLALSLTTSYAHHLDAHVAKVLGPDKHVASFDYHGEKVWAKHTDSLKTGKMACFKHYVSKLIPYRVLRPTYYCGSHGTFQKELQRLHTLKEAGIPVPTVIAATEEWVILSDMGEGLDAALSHMPENKRTPLLKKAARALAELHNKGHWHGRGHIKDITFDGEHIGFIDFEEDPSGNLTPTECQARDVLMFCYSLLERISNEPRAFKEIIDEYKAHAPQETWDQVMIILSDIRPLIHMVAPFADMTGRDLRRAVAANRAFDEILQND